MTQNSTRRGFLSIAVTAIVVGVVAGVGGYYAGLMGTAPGVSTATVTTPGTVSTATVTVPTTITQTVPTTVTTTATSTTTTTPTTTVPKPDKVTLITWGGAYEENVRKYVGAAFQNQYGIPLNVELEATSAEGFAKVKADWPRVSLDVVTTTPSMGVNYKNAGYSVPLDNLDIPNLKDVPDSIKLKLDGKVYGHAIWSESTIWTWNTEKFPKGIHAVSDILDLGLQGRVTCGPISDYSGGFVIQLAYARGGSESNMEPGWQFMKELAEGKYIKTITRSDSERMDALARGEIWAAWMSSANCKVLQDKGVPIEGNKIYTDSRTYLGAAQGCIIDGPRKEWAAKALNTWLDPAVCEPLSATLGNSPPNMKASPTDIAKKYNLTADEIPEHGFLADPTVQSASLPAWTEKWEKEILPLLGL